MKKTILIIAIVLVAVASVYAETEKATTNLTLNLSTTPLTISLGFYESEKTTGDITSEINNGDLEEIALAAADSNNSGITVNKDFYICYYVSGIKKTATVTLKALPLTGTVDEETVYLNYTLGFTQGTKEGALAADTTPLTTVDGATASTHVLFTSNDIDGTSKGNIMCNLSITNEELLTSSPTSYTSTLVIVTTGE